MPPAHRAHLEWSPSRLVRWAPETGPRPPLLPSGSSRAGPTPILVAAGLTLNRLQQHIQQREQGRNWDGPSR